MCKKLEETVHLHVRRLCQDSTFGLFYFLSNFFSPKSKLLNLGCGLSASAAYTPAFTLTQNNCKTEILNNNEVRFKLKWISFLCDCVLFKGDIIFK